MTDLGKRFADDLEALKQVRDELRVQAHLGKAEAKEQWERLERRWHELEAKLGAAEKQAKEPLENVRAAARLMLDEIREGYRKIKAAI